MNDENKDTTNLAVVDGDGGSAAVTAQELTDWKNEIQALSKSGRYLVTARRWAAERARHCLWDEQTPDGRKHASAQDGRPAFPFEGASDVRVRLADMVVNERVLLKVAAALRNLPTVKALDLSKQPLGAKLTTLLKWVVRNKLGSDYLREIVKLAQYEEADSPAGAVAGVWWEQQWSLKLETVTYEQLMLICLLPRPQGYGFRPEAWAEVDAAFQDPARDAETAKLLLRLIPELRPARAKKMVAELRQNGQAEFPRPYQRANAPSLVAYRLYEDLFFPPNTTDITRRCRWHLVREWLSEADLRARIVSEGYREEFVTAALQHEGQSAFPEFERQDIMGEFVPVSASEMHERHRGEYEILTVLFRATNDDNIPCIYYFPFHQQVDTAAHERRPLDFPHGNYPLTGFFREILSSRVLDSRGAPELLATDQHALKLLTDSFNDNVTLATLPNLLVPRRRTKLALVIGPLKVIKEDRPGDVRWMQPPQYPAGNEKHQQEIRQRVNEYWGRLAEGVLPQLVQLHQAGMTFQFLTCLQDVLKQMLQLCQAYMTDEEIRNVCGDDGIPIARTMEEIQGDFTVELTFDPAMMDVNTVKEIVTLIFQVILPADQLQTAQRDRIIQWALGCISPNMAATWTRPVDAAQQSEIADERNNLMLIQNGMEPPMVAEGINPQARLAALQDALQRNPTILENLRKNPVNLSILEARVKYLQNQLQQQRNAVIGRQVGEPALGAPGLGGMAG